MDKTVLIRILKGLRSVEKYKSQSPVSAEKHHRMSKTV